MRLIWTKSKLPLSVAIRWGLNQPVSHFAIVFKDCLLFQSNLLGTSLSYYPWFVKKHGDPVYEIGVQVDSSAEERIFDATMMSLSDKKYDYPGFFYFCWRAFLKKVFKKPMPAKNAWAEKDSFLCVGLMQCLDEEGVPEWLRAAVRKIPDSEMISPYESYVAFNAALLESKS